MTISPSTDARLVASTANDYNYTEHTENGSTCQNLDISAKDSNPVDHDSGNFRSLSWSADGTTIVTTSVDNNLRTFILPPNLLEPPSSELGEVDGQSTHLLEAYSSHAFPTPIYATALSPYYNLSTPETTLILASSSALPIRLISPFAPSILATYPLVNQSTEEWIAPHSLLFSVSNDSLDQTTSNGYSPGASLCFVAGSQNQISFFDINRDGSGPTTVLATAPGNRKARRGGSIGMPGIVSAMAMSIDGILAAGTFSRGLGLYDSQGTGDTIGTWSLTDTEDGSGATSLHWSKCGRYLVVAERGSDGMGVWDIRGTGKRLAWLAGRKAETMQRLGVAFGTDLANQASENVYAGGTDGVVRVWNHIGMKEGVLENDWQWDAHEDVVSGLGVHACGSVVATCSGSRRDMDTEDSENESDSGASQGESDTENHGKAAMERIDNSIRIWSLEQQLSAPSS